MQTKAQHGERGRVSGTEQESAEVRVGLGGCKQLLQATHSVRETQGLGPEGEASALTQGLGLSLKAMGYR